MPIKEHWCYGMWSINADGSLIDVLVLDRRVSESPLPSCERKVAVWNCTYYKVTPLNFCVIHIIYANFEIVLYLQAGSPPPHAPCHRRPPLSLPTLPQGFFIPLQTGGPSPVPRPPDRAGQPGHGAAPLLQLQSGVWPETPPTRSPAQPPAGEPRGAGVNAPLGSLAPSAASPRQ